MKPMLILIAGPYKSGTGNDPVKIAQNLERLEKAANDVYACGHIPLIGEWLALPIARFVHLESFYSVADRMLLRCDAVYRIPGDSIGAEGDLKIAKKLGLPIFYDLNDIPKIEMPEADLKGIR